MKTVHIVIGLLIVVYIIANVTRLGIGEILSIVTCVTTLIVAAVIFKTDLSGMFLAGMLMGTTVEFITEAYWDYSFNIYIWRDIPFFVILGWGFSFSMFVKFSNFIFKIATGQKDTLIDKRIIIFDAFLAPIWFIPYELLGMHALHLWKYSEVSNWNHILPIIEFPLEGVVGAFLFGMVLPTFVRHWGPELQFTCNARNNR